MRRFPALVAVVLAAAAAFAPSASADSIVYEKGGNVWLANPDGSGQHRVTTSGGYSRPSQADDGTIVAAKGDVLHRLSRSGRLLNPAGDDDYGGKIFTDFSPDGALVSYGFFANGPILTGPYAAVSHSNRPTEKEEIDGPLRGYLNPSWLDSNNILLFPQSLIVDVQIWPIPGNVQDWFIDSDANLGGGEVDRAMTRFAAIDEGGTRILIYRLNAPPPAPPERRCQVTGAVGTFFRPTWSPDGRTLAWQEDDGIHTLLIDLDTCGGDSSLAIAGGKHPDWGPADSGALTAKTPRRIRLNALMNGLTVRVSCSCTVTATLLLAKKAIGKARKAVAGSGTLKVKPNRAGKERLRRGGTSVSVRLSAGRGSRVITRRVKVLR